LPSRHTRQFLGLLVGKMVGNGKSPWWGMKNEDHMTARRKPLTAKEIENVRTPGKYAVGNGVFLSVGKTPNSKSWIKRYRFHGKRHDKGLGSFPEVSLAEARAAGAELGRLIAQDIDPIKHDQKQSHAPTDNTFKAIADNMIEDMSTLGEEPWKPATKTDAEYVLRKFLTPFHKQPIDQITATDLFDLVLKPMCQRKIYRTVNKVRLLAYNVFRWGYARGALKPAHPNPASLDGPLGVLLQNIRYRGGHYPSLDWQKIPAFITRVQTHIHGKTVLLSEAAILVGQHRLLIRDHILRGMLKADRDPNGVHHWLINTDELFKVWKPVAELPPTPKTLGSYMLLVSVLLTLRPSEARFTHWNEYDPIEKRLIIPWQRTKEGRKIRRDHIVPLHPTIIEIFDLLRKHQHHWGIYRPDGYVFAQFPKDQRAKALFPPSRDSMREHLKEFLGVDDSDKTWHAMRDAFGSWCEERGFREKDKERALGHIKGFGDDDVSRRYNRQSKRTDAMREIFYSWAEFCLGGSEPTKVIPIRKHLKQA
jgi:integrase